MSRTNDNDKEQESLLLRIIYALFTIMAFVMIGRIMYIQYCWRDSDPNLKYYRAKSSKEKLTPTRGAILAYDGRLLAISTPMYQVGIDCAVQKAEYAARDKDGKPLKFSVRNPENPKKRIKVPGDEMERRWRERARELSAGLASIYGMNADYWYRTIINGRNEGKRYMKIGGGIDHETLQKVKELPLFREGANTGGLIIERMDTRQYPYGKLARRVIGYVKDNSRAEGGRNAIGLEGKFDYKLHGKEGYRWKRKTDARRIMNKDSTWAPAKDGSDIRTTLDIDMQDIADRALRRQLSEQPGIADGCVIVMDVKTGAIRTMVNLMRDSLSGRLDETYNVAISMTREPGSVFKTAILMSLLEDNKVKLSDKIPGNNGIIPGFGQDSHMKGISEISVLHGFEISSNYVFRKLAIDHYGNNPQKLLDNLYLYKLGEAYDFDLEGFREPYLPKPKTTGWSGTTLGSLAIGYNVEETPLHILTFYNAIANKGKMMKPYLVEDFEENGIVKEKRGPSILNGSICSRATADSLTKGLMKITEEGTAARRLGGAKLKVAGKTGTSKIAFEKDEKPNPRDPYQDRKGRRKYRGTFVGFFPAEQPKYSIICLIDSYPGNETFYGGTTPAMVVREIVDNIYAMDESYGQLLKSSGKMPDMSPEAPPTAKNGKVPNVKGLGLMDAIYAIENDGYRCSYSGVGHVVSQSPAAGSKLAEGGKVTIRLE